MKIALLGYMGCGKSTIGRELALRMNIPFLDLDTEIEKDTKTSIPDLFKEKGEIFFRKKESEVLEKLLNQDGSFILSLGGGTAVFNQNMEKINSSALSIYLSASPETLAHRLFPEKEGRPLIAHLKNEEELKTFIAKHLFERNPFYHEAQRVIKVDEQSVSQVVETIMEQLGDLR